MITELTDAHRALFPDYVKRFTDLGLRQDSSIDALLRRMDALIRRARHAEHHALHRQMAYGLGQAHRSRLGRGPMQGGVHALPACADSCDLLPASDRLIDRGEGAHVWDEAGRRYLDATAALWYCSVGYGRDEIGRAYADQVAKIHAYSNFGVFATEATVALADRLAGLSPMEDTVVLFGAGGSDAVDTAAKLVRRYWDLMGRPQKRFIVAREHGYHGMHGWGTSLAGIPGNKAGYNGAFIDEVIHVGAQDTEGLGALFELRGAEIAAFIGEPMIGAGDKARMGIFTYHLHKALMAGRALSYRELAQEIVADMSREGTGEKAPQPVFDGDLEAMPPGADASRRSAGVTGLVASGAISFPAGAMLGFDVGARLALYAPGSPTRSSAMPG